MKKMTMCKIESHLLKGFYMRSQDKLQLDQMYLNYKKKSVLLSWNYRWKPLSDL